MNSQDGPDRAVDSRVTTTLSQVVELLNSQGAQYALIGGLSVALRGNVPRDPRRGYPAARGPTSIAISSEALRERGCELNVIDAIRAWNDGGLLAVQWPGRVQVDFLRPVIPVLHRILERASDEAFDQQVIRVADAEGLLLLKLLAFRPLDREDIRGILLKNAGRLDLAWVRSGAAEVGLDQQRLNDFEQLMRDYYHTD